MDLVSIAQIASAIGTVGLTILFGFQLMVFRKQVAVNGDTLHEMRESRTAHERPQVIVLAYSGLTEGDLRRRIAVC